MLITTAETERNTMVMYITCHVCGTGSIVSICRHCMNGRTGCSGRFQISIFYTMCMSVIRTSDTPTYLR